MKLKITFLLPLFWLFISCNQNAVYSEFDKLPEDNRWLPTEVKKFEFEIAEDGQLYDLLFEFSHVYGYQFSEVPLDFNITDPDGKTAVISINLPIKDPNGKDFGDCSGDICDYTSVVREKIKFQKGHYKIVVSHRFEGPYLPNVIGVGIEVNKARP